MLKMYIAVLDTVPDYMVPVLVAHSALGAHLRFEGREDNDYDEWLQDSFKKCVIKINQKEFDKIAEMCHVYRGHENSTLGGITSCLVACPRMEWPNVIKFAKLWKPNAQVMLDKIPEETRFHYDA